jgi:hypothetical protein
MNSSCTPTKSATTGARGRHAARPDARKLGGVLSAALALVAFSACGSSSGVSGAYTTDVTGSTGLESVVKGKWIVTFGKHGSYTIHAGPGIGLSMGPGSYYHGTTFVIVPKVPNLCGPGPGTGVYKLKLSGSTLRFLPITEPCDERSIVLAHTYTKAH